MGLDPASAAVMTALCLAWEQLSTIGIISLLAEMQHGHVGWALPCS